MAEVAGPDLPRIFPRRDDNHQAWNWTSIGCCFPLDVELAEGYV